MIGMNRDTVYMLAGLAQFRREHAEQGWLELKPLQRQAWIDSVRPVVDVVLRYAAASPAGASGRIRPVTSGRLLCVRCLLAPHELVPDCDGTAVTVMDGDAVCFCHTGAKPTPVEQLVAQQAPQDPADV